jgi:ATP-dependent RNA helicase RhlE
VAVLEISLLLHFSEMNLSKPILAAVAEEGYDTPTPIQAKSIPPALEGLDLLGCAQTGTGKTAAFALPILNRLHTAERDKSRRGPVKPRALILAPTRELACQIDESFSTYGRHTGLRTVVIYGGVSQSRQVRALDRGVDIVVATPGRLEDLMEQRRVDLRQVEVFVLDEADRMLDMGFIEPIRRVASVLKKDRQTLLFSATMPKTIMHLADSLLRDPVKVAVNPVASAAPLIEQSVYMVHKAHKPAMMEHLLENREIKRALIFTRTKYGADKLAKVLGRSGVKASAIHGNKSQNQRQKALDLFRSGKSRVLVATDVAARGLDVDGITHVFNFDLPNEPEAYVHRIGRTGRAGATGIAISFCDRDERNHLRSIERLTKTRLKIEKGPAELTDTSGPVNGGGGSGGGGGGKPRRPRPQGGSGGANSQSQRRSSKGGHRKGGAGKSRRSGVSNAAGGSSSPGAASQRTGTGVKSKRTGRGRASPA